MPLLHPVFCSPVCWIRVPIMLLPLGQVPLAVVWAYFFASRQTDRHMVKTTLRLVDADSPGQCPTERMGTTDMKEDALGMKRKRLV